MSYICTEAKFFVTEEGNILSIDTANQHSGIRQPRSAINVNLWRINTPCGGVTPYVFLATDACKVIFWEINSVCSFGHDVKHNRARKNNIPTQSTWKIVDLRKTIQTDQMRHSVLTYCSTKSEVCTFNTFSSFMISFISLREDGNFESWQLFIWVGWCLHSVSFNLLTFL